MMFHAFESQAAAAEVLARRVAADLAAVIGRRGHAVLAVSGGRSPVPFLQALSAEVLDWSRVCVTLVDERVVAPGHADSNAGLVRDHLLQGGHIVDRHLDHQPAAAGDRVALGDLRHRLQRLQHAVVFQVFHRQLDQALNRVTQLFRVDYCPISGNDTGTLQFFHSFGNGRCRQADAARQLGVAETGVFMQCSNDFAIKLVHALDSKVNLPKINCIQGTSTIKPLIACYRAVTSHVQFAPCWQ